MKTRKQVTASHTHRGVNIELTEEHPDNAGWYIRFRKPHSSQTVTSPTSEKIRYNRKFALVRYSAITGSSKLFTNIAIWTILRNSIGPQSWIFENQKAVNRNLEAVTGL